MNQAPECSDCERLRLALLWARRWIADYDERHRRLGIARLLGEASLKQYARRRAYLLRAANAAGEPPGYFAQRHGSAQGFVDQRSACYWLARRDLPGLIASAEAWLQARPPSHQDETWPEGASLHARLAELVSFAGRRGERATARPRRLRIRQLPPDWRATLARALPPPHHPAFLVTALTGCRPKELAAGVEVDCQPDRTVPRALRFRIAGAKITRYSGQPERIIEIDIRSAPSAALAQTLCALAPAAPHPWVVAANIQRLNRAVKRTAAKLWPEAPSVSLYSLRYQFADEMRRAGADRQLLAAAMGHTSDKSQRAYTRARRAPGIGAPDTPGLGAVASRPVRGRTLEALERLARALDRSREKTRAEPPQKARSSPERDARDR